MDNAEIRISVQAFTDKVKWGISPRKFWVRGGFAEQLSTAEEAVFGFSPKGQASEQRNPRKTQLTTEMASLLERITAALMSPSKADKRITLQKKRIQALLKKAEEEEDDHINNGQSVACSWVNGQSVACSWVTPSLLVLASRWKEREYSPSHLSWKVEYLCYESWL